MNSGTNYRQQSSLCPQASLRRSVFHKSEAIPQRKPSLRRSVFHRSEAIPILLIISLFLHTNSFSQKVGLVLSGGGSNGLAHIGVIKALEENNIPIDYITGTSIGAFVGAMYASGYSPEQIEALVLTEEFKNGAYGKTDDKYTYYFKQNEQDGSWINVRFNPSKAIETSLPTNIISPISTNLKLLELLSGPAAAANYKFDSLFIPYRSVASDIESKALVIFREGDLAQAVRASITYPFFVKPIKVDGHLLFDGGLYNNFPSNIMYEEFLPDLIIGSNVSSNAEAPDEDNLISQIKCMLENRTNYFISCENSIMIEPETGKLEVFNFDNNQPIIDAGYKATILKMDEINSRVQNKISIETLNGRRRLFFKRQPELIFDEIKINGLNRAQSDYVKRVIQKRKASFNIERLRSSYFRLVLDDKFRSVYPRAKYNKETGRYDLILDVKTQKDFLIDFGGNFSSRPINQAFIGIKYNYLTRIGLSAYVNSYFGKLYGSSLASIKADFPYRIPFHIEGSFVLNRWDFYKSSSTFFEDVKPSYLVQNERFFEGHIGVPAFKKGRIHAGATYGFLRFDYYQTNTFFKADTADKTNFDMGSPYILYERSTLNRKQYANSGTYFLFKARYIEGNEFNVPGSTSKERHPFKQFHQWYQARMIYKTYFNFSGIYRPGLYFESVYSSQDFFNNYTSSILIAPSFEPIPESKTLFIENYRSHVYAAAGFKNVFLLPKNVDLRLEGYIFQPQNAITRTENQAAKNRPALQRRYFVATAAAVYQSPIGPVSVSLNYYNQREKKNEPFSFLFHFGYIIFNKRALD